MNNIFARNVTVKLIGRGQEELSCLAMWLAQVHKRQILNGIKIPAEFYPIMYKITINIA